MQPCDWPFQHAEPGASKLHTQRERQSERLAQVDVIAHREIHPARLAPGADHDIATLVGRHRHALVRQVRHRQQQRLQLRLDLLQPRGRLLEFGLQRRHLRHHRIDRLTLAFELADLFGKLVALRLQILGTALDRLAFGLQRSESGDVEKALRFLAGLEPRDGSGEVFSKQGDV